MAQNRANSSAFIEADIYSGVILRTLEDGLLPEQFYHVITGFTHGTTYNMKTIGTVTIQNVAEDVPVDYTSIESGTVTMKIQNYVGDAWYVTDELKEDGTDIPALMNARSMESSRAMKEIFESRFLAVAAAPMLAGVNTINGFDHSFVASGANNTIEIADFLKMKIAFDKANVPLGGRVAIVDPLTAATIASKVNLVSDISDFASKILLNGFDKDHEYITTVHGWHVFTSNRLPKGSYTIGATTVTAGVANVFMSVADDNTKPIMQAWRRMPSIETERNKDLRRQEFVTTARYGFGVKRLDTLGVIVTNALVY